MHMMYMQPNRQSCGETRLTPLRVLSSARNFVHQIYRREACFSLRTSVVTVQTYIIFIYLCMWHIVLSIRKLFVSPCKQFSTQFYFYMYIPSVYIFICGHIFYYLCTAVMRTKCYLYEGNFYMRKQDVPCTVSSTKNHPCNFTRDSPFFVHQVISFH